MARYNNHSDGGTGTIVIMLLAGVVYAHRSSLVQMEDYARAALLVTALLVLCVVVFIVIRGTPKFSYRRGTQAVYVDSMDDLGFERYVADLLRTKGFTNIQLTEEYDYGVDIVAYKNGIRWGIQCKRYSGLVKAEAVRQVVTALNIYSCDRAMVITNSYYSEVAKRLASSNNCVLIDRLQLLRLINNHAIQLSYPSRIY